MSKQNQVCTTCILDSSDPTISFNEKGECNYCQEWNAHSDRYGKIPDALKYWETVVVPAIKASGKGKKYDCIIGISGGVDSSFVAYTAKQYGLRALLVHASTGFDAEVAKKNLQRIVDYTGFDIVYPRVPECSSGLSLGQCVRY